MARKTSKRPFSLRIIASLAILAVVAFLAGEGYLMLRTDRGQLALARWLRFGDPARMTQLVGKHIRYGLDVAGVARDSIHELPARPGTKSSQARVHWRVGLKPDASLLQTNFTLTQTLGRSGLEILSGTERVGRGGDAQVVLLVGTGNRVTHEVVLSRMPRTEEDAPTTARLAIVVFGFGESAALARQFAALPAPFALALAPAGNESAAAFKAAHENGREVVLHLPLEPVNYPAVNPGPGTILVSMKPTQVAGLVRRYVDQAGSVAAVANLMGSLATQDMTVMSAVYRELRRQRLPFLHVMPAAGSVCKTLAADLGVAYEEPGVVIDHEARATRPAVLDKRWKAVLAEARDRGQLIVMVRATERTREWLPRALEPRRLAGVSVVPLSALLKRPTL